MKNRKSTFTVLVILLLSETLPTIVAQTSAPTASPPATTDRYQPTTLPPNPDDEDEAQEAQQIMDDQNKKSATIYGKAVDQYGQPVAGAQAIATSIFNVSLMASRNEDHFTTTDANGFFQFIGIAGAKVGFGVKKAGYVWNGQRTPPVGGQSTPQNREVFVMHKLQGAEPMVHAKIHDYIPCDGTEINYDLQTGKRVATGGDLIVKFTRNPVQIRHGKPFEWTLVLTVPGNGGLIELNDSYPYEAPTDGYQKTITITTGPTPSQYLDSITKSYYYKSADNKYGRINIELEADFQPPPASFDGSIYLNPSGSRNLEWDETKQVKP